MEELVTAFETNSSFLKLVTQSDVQPTGDAGKALLAEMDSDHNGQVSMSEFIDFFVHNEFARIHENSVVGPEGSCVGIEESTFGHLMGGTTGAQAGKGDSQMKTTRSSPAPSTMSARATPRFVAAVGDCEPAAFKVRALQPMPTPIQSAYQKRRSQRGALPQPQPHCGTDARRPCRPVQSRSDNKIDVDDLSERRRAQRQRRLNPQTVAWENARANCRCT